MQRDKDLKKKQTRTGQLPPKHAKGRSWLGGGLEEQVNWQMQKPPTEWVFDLWIQLKE
jgi:hypothetical protein